MKISIADLLKIVEANREQLKAPRQHVNDVHKFIEDLGIKDGKHKVNKKMVYKAYRIWGGKRTSASFLRLFSTYYQPHISGHDFKYYELSIRAVELINKVDKGLIKI